MCFENFCLFQEKHMLNSNNINKIPPITYNVTKPTTFSK